MKKRATRRRSWIRRHPFWSLVILITMLVVVGEETYWTVYRVRFGLQPPTGQSCGEILHSKYFSVRVDAAFQPLTCFWQAYQTCKAATISQTHADIDVAWTDTLTLEWWGDHCAIYGQEKGFFISESVPTEIFLCNLLSKRGDMLQVSECDGARPFALAPLDIPDESYSCGKIDYSSAAVDRLTQRVEACFFDGYQQCLAHSLAYGTFLDEWQVEGTFYVDNHCGLAYQHRSHTSTCASLESHIDGLHFGQCGTDGDIFISSDLYASPP